MDNLGFEDNIVNSSMTIIPNGTGLPDYPTRIVYPRYCTVFAAVCCIIFIVVGVIGNLLTVLALSCCIKLRNNATTAFVISLCVADLLFCSINLPLTASRYIHEAWILGDGLCQLFPFFFYGNVAASLMSMTAITINRYILINHHAHYSRIYQDRYIVLMIATVWLFSFSMLLPPLFQVWGRFGYHPETFSCTILRHNGMSPKKFLFVFGFVLPCVVIIVSYSCILHKVCKTRINLHNSSNGSHHSSSRVDEMRLTRLMLVIFCSFLLCFLPLMIVNVFIDEASLPGLHITASVFAWMSSCINPIIYAMMNRQYRAAYARVLRLLTCPKFVKSRGQDSSSLSGKTLATDCYLFNAGTSKVKQGNNGVVAAKSGQKD